MLVVSYFCILFVFFVFYVEKGRVGKALVVTGLARGLGATPEIGSTRGIETEIGVLISFNKGIDSSK